MRVIFCDFFLIACIETAYHAVIRITLHIAQESSIGTFLLVSTFRRAAHDFYWMLADFSRSNQGSIHHEELALVRLADAAKKW